MIQKKYKLRCRNNGIVVTTNPKKYNIVWIRLFDPEIYSIDILKNKRYEKNNCTKFPYQS